MHLQAAQRFLAEHVGEGRSENLAFRCEASKRLEDAGDYVGAGTSLGDRWRGAGVRPDTSGLTEKEAAQFLLRAGMLSHRIAVTEARAGAQDEAKEVLDEAARMFASLGDDRGEVEALVGVGLCYWRQTALDEARLILKDALARAGGIESEHRAAAQVALAYVEWSAGNNAKALRLFLGCRDGVAAFGSHRLKAGYHSGMALVRRRAGDVDAALVEDAAASYHLEKAGDIRQCAALENNVGNLLADARRFTEAYEHYDRAWELFTRLRDRVQAGRVDDSHAQALLAERRPHDAVPFARRGAEALEASDEKAAYVEGLLTLGTACARCGDGPSAWTAFDKAREVAHNYIGAAEAEKVWRVMLDELGPVLYSAPGMRYFDAKVALQRSLIKKALDESNWNLTRAAFNLGLKLSGLQQLLKNTHKDVWDERPGSKS